MLQTSSNQRNSHRLTRTPVTNVVNPSPKTAIISEKALRLTTFVTTDQKCAQKTPRIDDVCNNMHQSTPKNSTRETPVTPTGSRGTGPRCRRAVAGPGQTTSQRTEQHQRPGTTGVEGTGESGGPGCSARGRRRGLAGLRADAQAHVSTPIPTGVEGRRIRRDRCDTHGRRRGLAGHRADAPSHTPAHQAPQVWRAPEGLEGQAATPVGRGGAWPGSEATHPVTHQRPRPTGVEGAGGSGGHGRASRRGAERSEDA